MFGRRRADAFGGVLLIGVLALAVGIAGRPSWGFAVHVGLLLGGIVLAPIGLVGLIRPGPPRVATPMPTTVRPSVERTVPPHVPERQEETAVTTHAHVRDARIDRWGAAFGIGSLTFPADPDGRFHASDATTIRLEVPRPGWMHLVACSTRRDAGTEYLVAEVEGPTLTIGPDLATTLIACLRYGPKVPRRFALDGLARLEHGDDGDAQPLSDLRATIEQVDEGIALRVSAALRSGAWNPPDSIRELDAWPEDGGDRVELVLDLDAVTRAVRFGSIASALYEGELEPIPPIELEAAGLARLGSTPVGGDRLYGVDSAGALVPVSEGIDASLILSAPSARRRRAPTGLIDNENTWPRIFLWTLGLDAFLPALSRSRGTTIALEGSGIGSVHYRSGGSDGPGDSAPVRAVRIEASVEETGLRLSYCVQPEGRDAVEDSIVLPWQVLVLRTSGLRRWQQEYVDAEAIRRDAAGSSPRDPGWGAPSR